MLEIIPAIDLKDGRAVRLRRGDFATAEQVADDPLETAIRFAGEGATRLHIVDLDGARTGTPANSAIIEQIVQNVRIPVQVGGGVRALQTVQMLLDMGVARVVVGTSAAMDSGFATVLLNRYGASIIIGADVSDGMVAIRGWTATSGERAELYGRRMAEIGAQRFLFTDVARDGLLTGNNVRATVDFARAAGAPVIASGGVAGIEDIAALAAVQPDGVEGVIIGKALYAGRLTIADALRVVREAVGTP